MYINVSSVFLPLVALGLVTQLCRAGSIQTIEHIPKINNMKARLPGCSDVCAGLSKHDCHCLSITSTNCSKRYFLDGLEEIAKHFGKTKMYAMDLKYRLHLTSDFNCVNWTNMMCDQPVTPMKFMDYLQELFQQLANASRVKC